MLPLNNTHLALQKTRKNNMALKNPSLLYPSPSYGASNTSMPGFNFGSSPLCVDDATECDTWDFKDRKSDGMLHAQCVTLFSMRYAHLTVAVSADWSIMSLSPTPYSSSRTFHTPAISLARPLPAHSTSHLPTTPPRQMPALRLPCHTLARTSGCELVSV